jgi:uncharacterized glyoxalase superfamily protein PhnB
MTDATLEHHLIWEQRMGTKTATAVYPSLKYDDASAAIRFLKEAFGFEEALVVPGETESQIAHALLRWPLGGAVMLSSTGSGQDVFAQLRPGGSIYVVTDEPDALFERATRAGAGVVRELRDEGYGSRGFTVRDPEGTLWSFGTYQMES